jgi:ATPase subunit of ABC transporter with duplicated ATPase domains
MAQYVYTMRRVGKVVPPKRTILKNISLNFFPGAKIGVLGLNGAGKSSLLRIMAGADDNYDGEVIRMPGIRVGFLEQEPRLPEGKSVKEAVEEGMGETAAAKKRLDEVYAAYSEPAKNAASRSAGCCCRSPICSFWTSRRTTSTPRASSGWSSSCSASPAPWSQ